MRTRSLYLLSAILVLVGAVSLAVYLSRPKPPQPGITRDNAKRIQAGMTTGDVEAITGFPSQAETDANQVEDSPPVGSVRVLLWSGMECDILVFLNRERKVITVKTVPDR